jgi:DNA polymerase-3 subunit delta
MSFDTYLIAGEPFLAEEAIDRVRQETGSDPLSEVMLDATASPAEFLEALRTPSLLGGSRLVIVRDAQDLKKEQVEALTQHVEEPAGESTLVLVAGGRTKLDAVVKAKGAVVSLDAPKGRRLVTWLRDRAKQHGVRLDDRGGWALVDAIGAELRELDGAIEQLATAMGKGAAVGAGDVRKMFSRLADERMYTFTDAVADRRLDVAMHTLRRLLEQGDEAIVLAGALAAQLRRMVRARPYADQGKRAVADALGLPEWRAERLQRQARAYTEDELVDAMVILAEADVEMKGDFPSPEAALERAVTRIVSGQTALL